jgi:tetratricopeptide (TPR) repeat protein
MKSLFFCLLSISCYFNTSAQIPLKVLPSGGNKKAIVGEQIGLTSVVINYDRPGVKAREGKIWGELVPLGYVDQGFGTARKAPWRAGSNENTTIEFNTSVSIEGKQVPAGKYGVFIAYDPNESTLILSKNSSSWGSYYYDEREDALRVKVKPTTIDKSVEWLSYSFSNQTENSATVTLSWEKLAIPFRIEVDYIKDQLESFRKELRSEKGFIWESWQQAATWCLNKNVNLEEALLWADSASSGTFGGHKEFQNFVTKSQIQEKLGRTDDASQTLKKGMQVATIQELNQYGRRLLSQKKNKEAMELFKFNLEKNPNKFAPLVGMARGYSADGDFKTALKYAKMAEPLAPDEANKKNIEAIIEKLKAGKDIN